MISSIFISVLAASTTLASPFGSRSTTETTPLPPRYNGSTTGGIYLYAVSDREIPIQAQDGQLVFTKTPPARICPCSDEFGADNFTAFYSSGVDVPTLQLVYTYIYYSISVIIPLTPFLS